MAFSFAGLKTQVLKATTKFWPNLQLRQGMPEGLKRAVARRFQEVDHLPLVSLSWIMTVLV